MPYVDDKLGYGRLYPSGDHVPQWSGDGLRGMREWIGDGTDKVDNTDILLFHTLVLLISLLQKISQLCQRKFSICN